MLARILPYTVVAFIALLFIGPQVYVLYLLSKLFSSEFAGETFKNRIRKWFRKYNIGMVLFGLLLGGLAILARRFL